MGWFAIVSIVILGLFILTVVISLIAGIASKEYGEMWMSIGVFFMLADLLFLVVAVIPTAIGSSGRDEVDPTTAKYSVGTVEDLIGTTQTFRDCAPGDTKFTVVTGKTNDVSFWTGTGPEDYKEVLICR